MANDLSGKWISHLAEEIVRVDDAGGDTVLEFWGDSKTAFTSPRKQNERLIELGYWTRMEDPAKKEPEVVGVDEATLDALLSKLCDAEDELSSLRRMIEDLG